MAKGRGLMQNKDFEVSILVVDIDNLTTMTITQMLRAVGYKAIAVNSGTAAIKALTGLQFNVLLTSMSLGTLQGTELAKTAKLMQPNLRTVLMSGLASVPTLTHPAVDAALAKPFSLEQLTTAIETALAKPVSWPLEEEKS